MNNILNVMKKNKVVILLLLIIIVISIINLKKNKKITIKQKKEIESKNKVMLFYADWCGWSQKFLPVWKEFTNQCDKLNISHETIECTDNELCSNGKYNIEGFPTIILEANGNIIEYDGDRSVQSLLDFVKKNM